MPDIYTKEQLLGVKAAIEGTSLVTLDRAPTLSLIDHALAVMKERDDLIRALDKLTPTEKALH
jgi:hypothetical protein